MNTTTKSTINDLVKTGTLVWYNGSYGLCPCYGMHGLTKVHLKMTHRLSNEQASKLRQAVIDKCNEYAKKYNGWSKTKLVSLGYRYEKIEFTFDDSGRHAYMSMQVNQVYHRGKHEYGTLTLVDTTKPDWGTFDTTEYRSPNEVVFNADGSVDLIEYEPVQVAEDTNCHKHRAKCRNEWQKIFKAKLEDAFAKMKYVRYSKPLFDNHGILQVEFISA